MSGTSSSAVRSGESSLIVYLVAAAYFMENLDGTIIATALPQMARSFNVHPVDLSIGITSYLLTLAVFIPVSGWAADRFGVRNLFTCALAVFTASSVVCGMTGSVAGFAAARVVQGIGGAMMVPVGRLAVLRVTAKENLMRALAVITWPGLVAPVIGPPLGGFITTYSSWRWIFYLNLPLGLIGIVLAWRFVDNVRDAKRRPFDILGFVLCGATCTTLMYAMELTGRSDAPWREALTFLLAGVVAGVAALFHLRRTPHPVIETSALRIKTFAVSMVGGSLFRISISAVPFLLPLMFQLAFGMNALRSGLLTLAVFAGNLSIKPITRPIMRRFGFRSVLLVNGTCAALTLAAMSVLRPSTPVALMVAILFVSGLARSMQFSAINTLSFADVPRPQMTGASTLASTVIQMSMGMGVAFGAIALRIAAWAHGHAAQSVRPADFSLAFLIVAALGLAGHFRCVRAGPSRGCAGERACAGTDVGGGLAVWRTNAAGCRRAPRAGCTRAGENRRALRTHHLAATRRAPIRGTLVPAGEPGHPATLSRRKRSEKPIRTSEESVGSNLRLTLIVATIIRIDITYDPAKNESNIVKHGVSLEMAAMLDWSEVMAYVDDRADYKEVREVGFGVIGEHLYCVVFTQRGNAMHIISMSMRKANKREVKSYVEQT